MDYRTIPGIDQPVSIAGLGCNNFGMRIDADAAAAVVDAALDAGINFFDTARMYGGGASEEFLGRALAGRRERAVVATKFGMERDQPDNGGSPAYVRASVERSLSALGTDRIDLFQFHQPDPDVPVAETLGALQELVREGKVGAIGHSNLDAEQTAEAAAVTGDGPPFVTAQVEWSLLARSVEDSIIGACAAHGLGVLPYFPLASGMLTGKYRRDTELPSDSRLGAASYFADQFANDTNFAKVEALTAWADGAGLTLLELAMSWLASQPTVVSVIAGATRPEQVRANAAACRPSLSAEQLAQIDTVLAEASPG